jgi:hypothetical protein
MIKQIALVGVVVGAFQLSGCSLIAMQAASTRMEEARALNAGKKLIPKDGGSYLIAVGQETASYLGSGNTSWKINETSFNQPRGTYSVIKVRPGTYTVYGNKHVAGGGEATSPIEVGADEAICFFPVNPLAAKARMETYKGDACEPILRPLKNLNVILELK